MELLVYVQDKRHRDFYLDCQQPKRGDVIVVAKDGQLWGTGELDNPVFRIVVAPDLTPEDASMLLAPELNTDPNNPSKTLQFRAFKLDLDHPAVADQVTFFNDHTVIDVDAKVGTLAEVADVITVPVFREDITLLKDAQGNVTGASVVKVDVSYQETLYRAADLKQALTLKDTAVTMIGPKLRAQAAVTLPAAVILKIKTQKPPIVDPAVIGSAKAEF